MREQLSLDVRREAGEKNKSSLQRWSLRNSGVKNAEVQKERGGSGSQSSFFCFWLMTGLCTTLGGHLSHWLCFSRTSRLSKAFYFISIRACQETTVQTRNDVIRKTRWARLACTQRKCFMEWLDKQQQSARDVNCSLLATGLVPMLSVEHFVCGIKHFLMDSLMAWYRLMLDYSESLPFRLQTLKSGFLLFNSYAYSGDFSLIRFARE